MDNRNYDNGTMIVQNVHLQDGLYYGKWSSYRIDIEISFTQVAPNGMTLKKGTEVSYRTEIGIRTTHPMTVLLHIKEGNVYCKL